MSLGSEGVFVQPASATGIAALRKLFERKIEENAKVVSVLTGSGLKTLSHVKAGGIMECSLEKLEECMR